MRATCYVHCSEQCATREVVLEREDARALLGALGGDAVDVRLQHGDAAHLAYPLAVSVSQPPHRLCREARRLAAAQRNRQDAASIHLAIEPLRDVARAEDFAAIREVVESRVRQESVLGPG